MQEQIQMAQGAFEGDAKMLEYSLSTRQDSGTPVDPAGNPSVDLPLRPHGS